MYFPLFMQACLNGTQHSQWQRPQSGSETKTTTNCEDLQCICMYTCMYMRKGLGIFLENCEKLEAMWD